MRKVLFKRWIEGIIVPDSNYGKPLVYKEGTNCWSELIYEGYFHGLSVVDGSPIALIESDEQIFYRRVDHFKFVESPEADQLAEFAKAAMQGILTNSGIIDIHDEESGRLVSEHAIMQAKSLIAELNKHEPIENTGYTTPYLRIEQEQAYERMKALGINIYAQTFEQCVNDLLYRLENNNSHEQA